MLHKVSTQFLKCEEMSSVYAAVQNSSFNSTDNDVIVPGEKSHFVALEFSSNLTLLISEKKKKVCM
jgi:hypothetical protein